MGNVCPREITASVDFYSIWNFTFSNCVLKVLKDFFKLQPNSLNISSVYILSNVIK